MSSLFSQGFIFFLTKTVMGRLEGSCSCFSFLVAHFFAFLSFINRMKFFHLSLRFEFPARTWASLNFSCILFSLSSSSYRTPVIPPFHWLQFFCHYIYVNAFMLVFFFVSTKHKWMCLSDITVSVVFFCWSAVT